ncbi:MAG: hypothetical protein V1738_04970 [Patescibacteria group bacterium]
MKTKNRQNKLKYRLSVLLSIAVALILFSYSPIEVSASFVGDNEILLITVKPDEPPGQAKKDDTDDTTNGNSNNGQSENGQGESNQPDDQPGQTNSDDTTSDTTDDTSTEESTDTTETTNTSTEDTTGQDTAPGQIKKTDETEGEETINEEADDATAEETSPADDDDRPNGNDKEINRQKIKAEIEAEIIISEPEEVDEIYSGEDINGEDVSAQNTETPPLCAAGNLIKTSGKDTVYYCANDGKRYLFPHRKVYESWYDDFSAVMTISDEVLYSIPLGGMITYRPGVRMIKTTDSEKTYAVDEGHVLRWVENETVAEKNYGKDWNQKIDDVSLALMNEYVVGEPISLEDIE